MPPAAAPADRLARVLVNGPAAWNTLVLLDDLPEARPHMAFARRHWQGLGGTSAGKALALARLGVPVALHTVLGTDDDDGVADFQEPFRAAADVLVVSEDRLPDPRAYLTARVAGGAQWAVCTRGSRGAVALGAEEGWLEVDAIPVPEVVDTNGAGDAFVAGMVAARLDGLPLAECLRWGAVAGAQCVQTHHLVPDLVRADVAARAHAAEVRGGGRD